MHSLFHVLVCPLLYRLVQLLEQSPVDLVHGLGLQVKKAGLPKGGEGLHTFVGGTARIQVYLRFMRNSPIGKSWAKASVPPVMNPPVSFRIAAPAYQISHYPSQGWSQHTQISQDQQPASLASQHRPGIC